MEDNISKIKERLSVVDVLSSYIKVQKSGINFKARCPFHNEKTPSFYISPERQIWHCFGCQKGGDIFGFVKEIEGVDFPEALEILAQRAGVTLERYNPAVKDERAVLYEICETASRFFEKQLHQSPIGKTAGAYLKNRGLTESTIKEFRLGFAPEGWHNLAHFLRDCGYEEKDVIKAGLILKREDGSDSYDRFRSRIIFPIADINDRIVGFTGRVFSSSPDVLVKEETQAKYINTPQTPIYDKSRVLYGLNRAKTEVRRADRCLLVEGNMDAIMSYQAGVKNTAATSGTALTPSHLQLLQRYTNNLDFCFDTDQAGLVATRRGLGLALSQNLNIKIVQLNDPDCKDPADYVKKFGNKWQDLVQSSKPVLEFYFDKVRSEVNVASVDGKKAIIASLGPLINRLSSKVERAHWISRLSSILKAKEDAVEADIMSVRDDLDVYVNPRSESPIVEQPEKSSGDEMFGEALLAVILKNPPLFYGELSKLNTELLDPDTAEIIKEMSKRDKTEIKLDDLVGKFDEQKRFRLEFANLKAQELLKDFSDKDLMNEFVSINNKLKRNFVSAKLTALEMDIKAAEEANEKTKLTKLMAEFNNLTKELNKS